MHKIILFLVTLCFANFVLAGDNYWVWIENNDGSKHRALATPPGYRFCYCLSKTQTNLIDGTIGGDVKLFSTSDCTGNYSNGSGKKTYNSQWVNSVSFGVSNRASEWGAGTSCNQYA
ncbi:hypothetical protein FBU30_005644 [Linnemannia zychae]|nr:hypothetical protein FBU30_005644 [Linnemannia zychae]